MKKIAPVLLLACLYSVTTQAREEILLEKGWRFSRTDDRQAVSAGYDDSGWQAVTVPHDWAIYGPFDINNDPQFVAIVQDGETQATLKAGRTGGLPFAGVGWYRLHFDAPDFGEGKKASVIFDGAMSDAHLWLNGHFVGNWPYGYNSFHFDITPYLKPSGNVLSVRLENFPESSRWYPGAGLYRNVRLVITEDIHIPVWGTHLTTPEVDGQYARVELKTEVRAPKGIYGPLTLDTEIKDNNGNVVATSNDVLAEYDGNTFRQHFVVRDPLLWSPDAPELYTAESKLYLGEVLKDEYSTRFGIRKLEIVPDSGMFLNGEPIKFKGVCNHHDLGPLGAAVNKSALRRQLTILKDMGCNAIRTSHNMPTPELVELCDEMGFMMMVETFDEWRTPKMKNGYNLLFDEWAEKDLVNTIHNYRNNPSVVMWCIGNEVPDQSSYEGAKLARWLRDICHREDPTRPVTTGIDRVEDAIATHFAAVMDVVGFNYRTHLYKKAYEELPHQIMMGCETASTFSSRGTYHFPVERVANATHPDNQSSGYDLEHGSWSNLPEDDFVLHDDYRWCIGEFVWTGFDYLGEPAPYHEVWPNHSSVFGIIDLAGIPKDRYYLYRSHWNSQSETLHILPHWTWPGREGQTTPVFVYTNYPSAELFVNGKSQGRIYKDTTVTELNSDNPDAARKLMRQRRYRLMWMDVKYEPGTIRVVAYDAHGNPAGEKEVHTAGKPHRIELSADRTVLNADGKDLSFITAKAVDRHGNLCPEADFRMTFDVTGAGSYRAAANGDPTCLDQFHLPSMKLFKGQAVVIVQSSEQTGKIRLRVRTKGMPTVSIELESKKAEE